MWSFGRKVDTCVRTEKHLYNVVKVAEMRRKLRSHRLALRPYSSVGRRLMKNRAEVDPSKICVVV